MRWTPHHLARGFFCRERWAARAALKVGPARSVGSDRRADHHAAPRPEPAGADRPPRARHGHGDVRVGADSGSGHGPEARAAPRREPSGRAPAKAGGYGPDASAPSVDSVCRCVWILEPPLPAAEERGNLGDAVVPKPLPSSWRRRSSRFLQKIGRSRRQGGLECRARFERPARVAFQAVDGSPVARCERHAVRAASRRCVPPSLRPRPARPEEDAAHAARSAALWLASVESHARAAAFQASAAEACEALQESELAQRAPTATARRTSFRCRVARHNSAAIAR